MKNITAQLLALVIFAMCVTPTAAIAKGHRVIFGHAQGKQCRGGMEPLPIVECRTWSIPAVVDVYTDNFEFVSQVISDDDGYFEVSDLRPGTYVLMVSFIGTHPVAARYRSAVQAVTAQKNLETPIDFFLWLHDD